MSHRPIIDAGPGLNFLSINKERLLCAPGTVQNEVLDKAERDSRFAAAAQVWRRLTPRWIQILPDEVTPGLAAVVQRITGQPMGMRMRCARDLGELMVIAHAVVAAEAGQMVTVLIDDGQGARIATSEIRRLGRLRSAGATVGSIRLVNTLTVLRRAAGTKDLPDRAAMSGVYQRLRGLDDGLPPIATTDLLSADLWR